MRKFFKKHQRT